MAIPLIKIIFYYNRLLYFRYIIDKSLSHIKNNFSGATVVLKCIFEIQNYVKLNQLTSLIKIDVIN